MKNITHPHRFALLALSLLCFLLPSLAQAQDKPVRIGIYQYHDNRPSWELPNPSTIKASYDAAFGAANVTIAFTKSLNEWIVPTDLNDIDVLWISRFNGNTATVLEQQLMADFVKDGKHIVFSSVETHSGVLGNIVDQITEKTITLQRASASSNPFPNTTDLFGLATGLSLSNTGSYDNYNGIPLCNRVADRSLFFVPNTKVKGGTMFASGEIQAFSLLQNNQPWRTLIDRIAGLHQTYMYGTQAELVAKDTTNFLNSPCATDVVVADNVNMNIDTPPNGSFASDNTPTVSGGTTKATSLTVTIEDSNGVVVETQVITPAADGSWSFDAMTLADGMYTIRGIATNGTKTKMATPTTFVVDTVAPNVTLATPANGTSTNDDTPTVSGTGDTDATLTVTIFDGNNNVVATLNPAIDAQGNWTIDTAQLPEGTYTAEAVAVDPAGNTTTAGPNTFTIDITSPSITLDTPVDGALINDNTPTISGTTEPNTSIEILVSDANGIVQTLNTTSNAQGDWSIDTMQLADGPYAVVATATDAAGNTTPAGPNTFTVDSIAPTVTLITPASGTSTNDDTPTLSGTTNDPTATVVITITDANGLVQTRTPTVDAQGNWTIDADPALTEGNYSVNAVATDAAGNVGTSMTNTFTIDQTAPALTLDTPANGTASNDDTPTVSGTSEPMSAITVQIKDPAGTIVQTLMATTDANGAWSVDAAQLPDGPYTVDALAIDAAGNTTPAGPNSFSIDTTAPTVSITTPADGASTNNNAPAITGDVEANTTLVVVIKDNAGAVVQTFMPDTTSGTWTVNATALADGQYTIEATTADAAGNTATAGPNTLNIDTTAPALTLDAPTDGAASNDDTPTVSGTSEPMSAITVQIKDPAGTIVQTLMATTDANGAWSVDAAQLPEGSYTVDATTTDAAGNTAVAGPNAFDIDTTAPTIAITAPTANQVVAERNVNVTGTSDPNQQITVNVLDMVGTIIDTQTVTTDANGDWTIQTANLANGQYTANATATDDAGNSATATQTFSVDSDEALVQITAPADASSTNEVRPPITGTADTDATLTVTILDGNGNAIATLTPTVDANGDWTITPDQDLADGTYTIEAVATRPNGKMANTSVTVTVDATKPVTTITTPADGMVSASNQPNITGTTEPGAEVIITITDDMGTVVHTDTVTADDQGNWSTTPTTPLDDNTYTIDAKSTDAAGNEGDAATSTFTVDSSAPTVTITAPANDDVVDNDTPTISGTAAPGATVKVLIDGVEVGEVTADDQGNWTFDTPNALAEGEHTIEATTTNMAGNQGTSGEIKIQVKLPKDPVVITSPTEGDDVTGPDVTVTGTGTPGEEVTVTIGGQTQTAIVDDNGDWTTTFTEVPAGEQTISAKGDGDLTTINVNIVDPITDTLSFVTTGGACSSTNASPTSSLWLLGMVGLLALRRRRQRA